jgi:hypothetical protein
MDMPWGDKKSEVPEELKDLGLTPAQMREAILNNKRLTEDLANSKTELSTVKTNLSQLDGRFNETKRTLDELEANSRKPARQTEDNKREYTSFIDDENKAFTERLVDGMQPIAQIALQSAANSAMLLAKQSLQGQSIETAGGRISLSRLWDKWSVEIDKAASEVNLVVKGNAQTWLNLFDYIKGKHINELLATPQTFVESVQTNIDKGLNDEKKPDKLNDEENVIITKMSRYGKGVTPESYQKMKSTIKSVTV